MDGLRFDQYEDSQLDHLVPASERLEPDAAQIGGDASQNWFLNEEYKNV